MPNKIYPEELVEFDSPIAEFFRTLPTWASRPLYPVASGRRYIPAADVYTRNGSMVVKLDLPGVDPKDVHVKLIEDELVITGERKADKEVKAEGYHRKETVYGYFERHVTVPKGLKESDIKAEFENGVLMISYPKPHDTLAPKAKEIPVKHSHMPLKELKPIKK